MAAQPPMASASLLIRAAVREVMAAAANPASGDPQESQTSLQRAEAAHALEVLRHEEEEADQDGVQQEARGVGAGAPAVGEQPQRHQWLLHARLIGDEE